MCLDVKKDLLFNTGKEKKHSKISNFSSTQNSEGNDQAAF